MKKFIKFLVEVIYDNSTFMNACEAEHYENPSAKFPYKKYFTSLGKIQLAKQILSKIKESDEPKGMYIIYKKGYTPIKVTGSFPSSLVDSMLTKLDDSLVIVSTYSNTIKRYKVLNGKYGLYIAHSEFKY